MSAFARRLPVLAALVVGLAASAASGCGLAFSLDAEAKDQWERDYALEAGGTLEIRNPNGRVDLAVTDGDRVTIQADRIVNAASQEAADRGLEGFDIKEEVTADRIVIDTAADNGVTINMRRRVNYTVRVPRWANVTLTGSNGEVVVDGLEGRFEARLSNGRVVGTNLAGPAAVRTTNGAVALQMAKVGSDGLECETTNGAITLDLPASAGANVSARVTNGRISHEGLDVQVIEESRRRLDARVGGGGPDVRLSTTNGAIRLRGQR